MTLLAIALVIGMLVALERSSLVALERVEVRGVQALTEQDVIEAADLDLGTSTVRLRLGAAEEAVESLPRVASATVQRQDPITVVIDVVERRPARIVVSGARRFLIDDTGRVIALAAGESLPTIDMVDETPIGVGMSADDIPALAAAVAVLEELPGPVRVRVARVDASSGGGVVLLLDDGVLVRVGDRSRVPEKARALAAVLEDLAGREVAVIDVRAPSAPVVVPVGEESPTTGPTPSEEPSQ